MRVCETRYHNMFHLSYQDYQMAYILRVRVRVCQANYDPDFDLAKGSHQVV